MTQVGFPRSGPLSSGLRGSTESSKALACGQPAGFAKVDQTVQHVPLLGIAEARPHKFQETRSQRGVDQDAVARVALVWRDSAPNERGPIEAASGSLSSAWQHTHFHSRKAVAPLRIGPRLVVTVMRWIALLAAHLFGRFRPKPERLEAGQEEQVVEAQSGGKADGGHQDVIGPDPPMSLSLLEELVT